MAGTSSSTGAPGRERPAGRGRLLVALAACLAVAVGTPVAWVVSRPDALAGQGLDAALPARATAAPGPEVAPSAAASVPAVVDGPARLPVLVARDAAPAVPARTTQDVSRPVELRIPAVGVLAPVDALGVDDDGAMDLPRDVRRTAWYRWGAVPGSGSGSAVLAGHVASADDGRGALAELPGVEPGDRVEVVTAAGDVLPYEVLTREAVVKDTLPVAELFADDGPERLVLVTCGGPYLRDLGSHRDNVVVVAGPL